MIIEVTESNQHIPEPKGRNRVLKTWLTRQGEVGTGKGGAEATRAPRIPLAAGFCLWKANSEHL